ncbi:MAG TPA: hypothetical protein VMN36_04615 [Verrucomicrobiales bacterium]|nr:hypothetical protein [Verrucomicrobiales bacterium]
MKWWLFFALMTVVMWGVYGVLLHTGSLGMADRESGRYKAFLLVGFAYFVVAIVGPLAVLAAKGGSVAFWTYPGRGLFWSFLAGTAGALGALFVLFAFASRGGYPAAVMSIVFAGAPVVNAFVAIAVHPPAGGLGSIRWPFYAGIVLAAAGGCLVTLFKPDPPKAGPPQVEQTRRVPGEARVHYERPKYLVT